MKLKKPFKKYFKKHQVVWHSDCQMGFFSVKKMFVVEIDEHDVTFSSTKNGAPFLRIYTRDINGNPVEGNSHHWHFTKQEAIEESRSRILEAVKSHQNKIVTLMGCLEQLYL